MQSKQFLAEKIFLAELTWLKLITNEFECCETRIHNV